MNFGVENESVVHYKSLNGDQVLKKKGFDGVSSSEASESPDG
jgi:hypothetical protein